MITVDEQILCHGLRVTLPTTIPDQI